MPEWLSDTGIPGTDGYNPLGAGAALAAGQTGMLTARKIRGIVIPDIESIQKKINEIGGQGVTESQASSIREELIRYKEKLTSKIMLPGSGRGKPPKSIFIDSKSDTATLNRPPLVKQETELANVRAPRPIPPRINEVAVPSLINEFGHLGVGAGGKKKGGGRASVETLVKDLAHTGGDIEKVKNLVEGTRFTDAAGKSWAPFTAVLDHNGNIDIVETRASAARNGKITDPVRIFDATGSRDPAFGAGPDASNRPDAATELKIQERFNVDASTSRAIIERVGVANESIQKASKLDPLSLDSKIREAEVKLNAELAGRKSLRGYRLYVEYDYAENQWNIREKIPPRSRGWKFPGFRGTHAEPGAQTWRQLLSARYKDPRAPLGKNYLEVKRGPLRSLVNPKGFPRMGTGSGTLKGNALAAALLGWGSWSDLQTWIARKNRSRAMPGAEPGNTPLDILRRINEESKRVRGR
jgi:hypothetical protein